MITLKATPRGKVKAPVVIDPKLKPLSGFSIGPDGDLYAAERFDRGVKRFAINGKRSGTFVDGLPDMYEFPDRRAGPGIEWDRWDGSRGFPLWFEESTAARKADLS